jgi:ribonuclease Y
MDQTIIYIIIGVPALIAGIFAGKLIFSKNTQSKSENANFQAQTIIKEAELKAENIKKEKLLEAKEK